MDDMGNSKITSIDIEFPDGIKIKMEKKLFDILKERGYVLKNAMAADLFPRCAHVESVVTLIKEER